MVDGSKKESLLAKVARATCSMSRCSTNAFFTESKMDKGVIQS